MSYFEQYITLRQNLWTNFEQLVRKGAEFPELLDVRYPIVSVHCRATRKRHNKKRLTV